MNIFSFGTNHLSFHYWLWRSSLWYKSALDYEHVSGTNYVHKARYQCTRFQPLRGSVWYLNKILLEGINSEGETVLTCIEVQYTIICQMPERCLKMLQNIIACYQELRLSFAWFDVPVLLWSASVWSRTDDWVLICYFQPLGGAFLRVDFEKPLDTMGKRLIGRWGC
jgi:hypothetical protein